MAKKEKISKTPVKISKEEAKKITAAGTSLGEALINAGFNPESPSDAPAMLTTYEVSYTYEGSNGKRYSQTSIVHECRNAQDAQSSISDELKKRGLNPDSLQFVADGTKERPDLNQEVAVEAQLEIPEASKKKTTTENKPDNALTHRLVNFNGKIVDVAVKNGDTRLLKITILVGSDIPRVSAELLDQFTSAEMLCITVEPLQMNAFKDNKHIQSGPVEEKPDNVIKPGDTKCVPKGDLGPDTTGETEDYQCPFCQAMHRINKADTRVMLKCLNCEKEWPIKLPPQVEEKPSSDASLAEAEAPAIAEDGADGSCVRCGANVGKERLHSNLYCNECWAKLGN